MLHYGESHQTLTNQRLHLVCVPAIMLSTLGLFASIPLSPDWTSVFQFNLSYVVIFLASIYYLRFQNFGLLVGVWAMSAVSLLIISTFGEHRFAISLEIFSVAWIGQFVGHKVEGKKPSFFEDIFFLLIGPLWVLYKSIPSIFPKSNIEISRTSP